MIYGLDLGTRRIAIACPELGEVGVCELPDTGKHRVILEDAGKDLGWWAKEWVQDLEQRHGVPSAPRQFYAEAPFAGFLPGGKRNIRTAIGQGLSAGGVIALLPGHTRLIDQSAWKKELLGDGSARKPDIRAWLEAHHPPLAEACGEVEDAFDAFCIGLYGAALVRLG